MRKEVLYQEIAGAIACQIRKGVWKAGGKLPSLRTISDESGVSLNTAIQAYYELERDRFIISCPKSGYIANYEPIRLSVPTATQPSIKPESKEVIDLIAGVYSSLEIGDKSIIRFSSGMPKDILLSIAKLGKELIRAMQALPGNETRYDETQGNMRLRRSIARFIYSQKGNLAEDDIVATAGVTNAVALTLFVITKVGDTIAVEGPVYFGMLQLASSMGLCILELPTNPVTGINSDALKKVLPQIKAYLLISDFNNPLGSCMPDEHKRATADMLAGYGIPLIEDDLCGDLFFGNSRPKPCKAFDKKGLVLWYGAVSRALVPGYRVGWVASGKFKHAIIRQKNIRLISTPALNQEAVANFMRNDRYENRLHELRQELYANSIHFAHSIMDYFPENTKIVTPQGGFMFWMELDKQIDATELYYRTVQRKINMAPGHMFTLQEQYTNCMRLSYGQRWTPLLEERLEQLRDIIKSHFN